MESALTSWRQKRLHFHFRNETLPVSRGASLHSTKFCWRDGIQLYALTAESLSAFQWQESTQRWHQAWTTTLESWSRTGPLAPLFVQPADAASGLLVLKTIRGLTFYTCGDDNRLELVTKTDNFDENQFHDIHGWNDPSSAMVFGSFYSDRSLVGLATFRKITGFLFHVIDYEALKTGVQYPLAELQISSPIATTGLQDIGSDVQLFVTDLQGDGNVLVVRSSKGVHVVRFDEDNEPRVVLRTDQCASPAQDQEKDTLVFGRLAGERYQDMVQVNASGLFVFQFSSQSNEYQLQQYSARFAKKNGWTTEMANSIRAQDINSDGKQEIIFTGPQGPDIFTITSGNRLLSMAHTAQLKVEERHGMILGVLPASDEMAFGQVLSVYENEIRLAEIDDVDFSGMTKFDDVYRHHCEDKTEVHSDILPTDSFQKTAREMLVSDQLDFTPLFNPVDRLTGKVKFNLPLFGTSGPFSKMALFYEGGISAAADILGKGWYLTKNLIILDTRLSVFPEDETYYLIFQNIPFKLKYLKEKSTNLLSVFTSDAKKELGDITVKRYATDQRWEVLVRGNKFTFGRSTHLTNPKGDDGIRWTLAWQLWRGAGNAANNRLPLATEWYLARVEDRFGNSVDYTYEVDSTVLPGGFKLTRAVYLKTARDNQGKVINFGYASKVKEEYYEPQLTGNFIDSSPVCSKYLTGYSFISKQIEQKIRFEYTLKHFERLLVSIQQESNATPQDVIRFTYDRLGNTFAMTRIFLPANISVTIGHEPIGTSSQLANGSRYSIRGQNNYRVSYSAGVILISFISDVHGKVVLLLLDGAGKELYSSDRLTSRTSEQFPLFGHNKVQRHETTLTDTFAVVMLYYENARELCMIHGQGIKWQTDPPCFEYDNSTQIKIADDFVVTNRNGIEIIEWDTKVSVWVRKQISAGIKAGSLIAVSDKIIFAYDDKSIWLGRKVAQMWRFKPVKTLPGAVTGIVNTFGLFKLAKAALLEDLIDILKSSALQASGNLVFLRSILKRGSKMIAVIHSMVVSRNYLITRFQKFEIEVHDLNKVSTELELKHEKNMTSTFKVGYNVNSEGIKLVVGSFQGFLKKEIDNLHIEIREQARLEMQTSLVKRLEEESTFLIESTDYHVMLTDVQTVVCNGTEIQFNGDQWEQKSNSDKQKAKDEDRLSIKLADKYILHKKSPSNFIHLYKQDINGKSKGSSMLDLKTNDFNLVSIMYPAYLAYKMDENTNFKIVEFGKDTDEVKITELPANEKLSDWSSAYALITEDVGPTDGMTLTVRQMLGLRNLLPDHVVSNTTLRFGGDRERATGYEYHVESAHAFDGAVYYEKVTQIPGNAKKTFGWAEDFVSFTNESLSSVAAFSSKGELVRTLLSKDASQNQERDETSQQSYSLFDKSGEHEITQFYPFEIKRGGVGYFGFEDYERNQRLDSVVTTPQWTFDQNDVQRMAFAFTGRNCLKLSGSDTDTLAGDFFPGNQSIDFVASCWLRSSDKLAVGNISALLKVYVFSSDGVHLVTLLSEVKHQFLDWFYLEVVVEMAAARQALSERHSDDGAEKSTANMGVSVKIAPVSGQTIYVDHVRFAPVYLQSHINVYDLDTWLVTEEITSSGLVRRKRYDDQQRLVVSVDEHQRIERLEMHSKSWNRSYPEKSSIEVVPEEGFYESFDSKSFANHWETVNVTAWYASPGQIRHSSSAWNSMKSKKNFSRIHSAGIRFTFSMDGDQSSVDVSSLFHLKRTGNTTELLATDIPSIKVANYGDVLCIFENNRLFLWIDAKLCLDVIVRQEKTNAAISLAVSGDVLIDTVVVMSQVRVTLSYMNALGEKVQKIQLESKDTSVVTHYLYDALGRQDIMMPPLRVSRRSGSSILSYQDQLITNDNPSAEDSVWKTGRLSGEVNILSPEHNGFGFIRNTYSDNPLDEEATKGLPGKEFAVDGPFAQRVFSDTNVELLKLMYPGKEGYSYRTELAPGSVENVSVWDLKGNRVAHYLHSPRTPGLLSTYEYDKENRLIVMLPPMYHQMVHTALNYTSFFNPSEDDRRLRMTLGTHKSYDDDGNLVLQSTPDSGKTEYLYNAEQQLQFVSHSNVNGETHRVVYHDYDSFDRLVLSGSLHQPLAKESLVDMLNKKVNSTDILRFQKFLYNDSDREPVLRYALKRSVTTYGGEPFIEESILNAKDNEISSRVLMPQNNRFSPTLLAINKKYVQANVREISYPCSVQGSPLTLKIDYTTLGEIEKVYVTGREEQPLVAYTYRADGQIQTEEHMAGTEFAFTRHYGYNAPGFLNKLEDKFLTERVSYTEGSYGGQERGDSTVYRTEFTANWHNFCDKRQLGLKETSFESVGLSQKDSATCFRALKEAGYLDKMNRQKKIYFPSLESQLPIICSTGIRGRKIASVLGKSTFPIGFGHSYDYGIQNELIKASYFISSEDKARKPLQPNSFSDEIASLTKDESQSIWNVLKETGFLIEDRLTEDISYAHGKRGKSLTRGSLLKDLRLINNRFGGMYTSLSYMLLSNISQKKTLSRDELAGLIRKWNPNSQSVKDANIVMDMLEAKGYIANALDDELVSRLAAFADHLPDIVRTLHQHFGRELGESEHDVESYDIDAHGNHKHFYTGFRRYKLSYAKYTNQVENVKYQSFAESKGETPYQMKHDSSGNVVQALHKGIQSISYHPASNRPTEIRMTNGVTVTFGYDVAGERVWKRVFSANGDITLEVQYLRDKLGRCMMETRITFAEPNLQPDVLNTVYVYGKQKLLGFFRRDVYHSVITDHEGSTRLLVRNGEVVAAYDYLPYGTLMRSFGADPEAHISYRYTGQEWDEETGLYNYHARMYDPDIGRFYQIDPQEQYFSPYMYAGNSPVTLIDPDGEFAFTLSLIIGAIGALVGGYLSGAAHNKSFNPGKWNWKDPYTYTSIAFGGLGGAALSVTLPTTLLGAAAYIGVGSSFAYLGAAAGSKSWNPADWDVTSPELWDGLFQGFSFGVGLAGFGLAGSARFGVAGQSTLSIIKNLSKVQKIAFAAGTLAVAGTKIYSSGKANNWDFKSPGLWFGVTTAVFSAPQNALTGISFVEGAKRVPSFIKGLRTQIQSSKTLDVFKNVAVAASNVKFQRVWVNDLKTGQNVLSYRVLYKAKPIATVRLPAARAARHAFFDVNQYQEEIASDFNLPTGAIEDTDPAYAEEFGKSFGDEISLSIRTLGKRSTASQKEPSITLYSIISDLTDMLLVLDRRSGRHRLIPKREKKILDLTVNEREENDMLVSILGEIKNAIKNKNTLEFEKYTRIELQRLLFNLGINAETSDFVVSQISMLFYKIGCIASKEILAAFTKGLTEKAGEMNEKMKLTDGKSTKYIAAQKRRQKINEILDNQMVLGELSNLFRATLDEFGRRFQDWSPIPECEVRNSPPEDTADDLLWVAYETPDADQCSAQDDCSNCMQSSSSLSRSMDHTWLKETEQRLKPYRHFRPRNSARKTPTERRQRKHLKERLTREYPTATSAGNKAQSWIYSTISFIKQGAKAMLSFDYQVRRIKTQKATQNKSISVPDVNRNNYYNSGNTLNKQFYDSLMLTDWQETVDGQSNRSFKGLVEKPDVSGTLMLADLLTRKISGETHHTFEVAIISDDDALTAALQITDQLQKAVKRVAKRHFVSRRVVSKIPFHRVQQRLHELALSSQFEKVHAELFGAVVGSDEEFYRNKMFVADIDESIADILSAWRKGK